MEMGKSLMLSESCQLILEQLLKGLEDDFTNLFQQEHKYSHHLEEEGELNRLELHFLLLLQALGTRNTSISARLLQEGNNWNALPKITSITGCKLLPEETCTLDFIEGAVDFAHSLERSGLVKVPGKVLKYLDYLAEKRRRSRRRKLSSKTKEVKMEVDSESGECRCRQGTKMETEAEREAQKRDQAVQTTDTQYAVISKVYLPRIKKPPFAGRGPIRSQGLRSVLVEDASRALFVAVERNDTRRVLTALKAGADVGWRWYGCTALLLAAASGHSEIIDILLEYGANIEESEGSGDRPLHYAVRWAQPSTVERLISAGADLTIPGQGGRTPLHIAAREGNPETINILLKAGAPIELPNINGNRAIHFAAMCGKNEAVCPLAAAGADLQAKGEFGKTALQLARACGHHSTAKLLTSLMAAQKTTDDWGKST